MFLFQYKAILRHFKNVTHADQQRVTGDPFSVVTLTRPGNSQLYIVNFSMKLYNRNTCEMFFFKFCSINSTQTEQHLIKEIACENMVSLCISTHFLI